MAAPCISRNTFTDLVKDVMQDITTPVQHYHLVVIQYIATPWAANSIISNGL